MLEGGEISRRHARIERMQDGAFYVTDLGSVNGILVGERRIPANSPVRLSPEQIVRIGGYWMEYEPKRELPSDVVLPVPSKLEPGEFQLDDYNTVIMPKPLPAEMAALLAAAAKHGDAYQRPFDPLQRRISASDGQDRLGNHRHRA